MESYKITMQQNNCDFTEKLEEFPYIKKYYSNHSFHKKPHPLICRICCNTYLFEFNNLEKFEDLLQKLDKVPFLQSIISESKNPDQFLSSLSELKVAYRLFDKVDTIEKNSKNKW
jgi:hypothetical protein